tara:strand:+ start:718 stop:963 length:246 start_codon:yes stop_codon:yes gene_type:complete
MGKWGAYNTGLEFFNNLKINDKIKYNKNNIIFEGEIIAINKPIKSCKVLKITKKIENNICVEFSNQKILILPNQADNCEVI